MSTSRMCFGSIPAGAGEPIRRQIKRIAGGVYPRGCGGALRVWAAIHPPQGLSPRVRGSQDHHKDMTMQDGSIPAGAGEPIGGRIELKKWRVYPRGCGGAFKHTDARPAEQGLSPRVRGSPMPSSVSCINSGSIPAGAGEPRPHNEPRCAAGVYPRGCGGAVLRCGLALPPLGLSPRVRGSLAEADKANRLRGSIPAGAGEPRSKNR